MDAFTNEKEIDNTINMYRLMGVPESDLSINKNSRTMTIDIAIKSACVIVPNGVVKIKLKCDDDSLDFMLEQLVLPKSCSNITSRNRSDFDKICNIKHINFENVNNVCKGALLNTLIKKVIGGKELMSLGIESFKNCSQLSMVDLSNSKIKEIDAMAFYGCKQLTTVKLNKRCTNIKHAAFENCINLSSINLENVSKLGSFAFNATSIYEANLENIKVIEESTFADCEELTNIYGAEHIDKIEANAFEGDTKLDLANGTFKNTRIIRAKAFSNCKGLNSLILDNIEELGAGAFYNSGLKEIYLGKNIKFLADNAFIGCEGIEVHIADMSNIPSAICVALYDNVKMYYGKIYVGKKLYMAGMGR